MGSIGLTRVCHPSTLRMVIWPEASRAQRSIGTILLQGSTAWVLIRRRNASFRRSMAFVVRAAFHCDGSRRVKVKRRSPTSSRLSATARHFSRHLRRNALRRVSTSAAVCGATQTSKPNTNSCVRQENPPSSQSSLSCASSSKWQMLSSKLIASGRQKPLDQEGYCSLKTALIVLRIFARRRSLIGSKPSSHASSASVRVSVIWVMA